MSAKRWTSVDFASKADMLLVLGKSPKVLNRTSSEATSNPEA